MAIALFLRFTSLSFHFPMPCSRPACPFGRRPGRGYKSRARGHGYCCNLCYIGDPGHTRNCTGHRHWAGVVAATAPQAVWATHTGDTGGSGNSTTPSSTQPAVLDLVSVTPAVLTAPHLDGTHNQLEFSIPIHWARTGDIIPHLEWYGHRLLRAGYDGTIPPATRTLWEEHAHRFAQCTHARQLTIYVLGGGDGGRSASTQFSDPTFNSNFKKAFINVHARGLDANAPELYRLSHVTGIDFDVQGVLVRQPIFLDILLEAIQLIELQSLEAFTFQCACATHTSCGCAILLATLVYPRARIVFSTGNTIRAAQERGMMIVNDCDIPIIASNDRQRPGSPSPSSGWWS